MGGIGAGVMALLFVLGIVLVIAWIILPFAIIGTKPLLELLIAETKKTNALLEEMRAENATVARLKGDASRVA